MKEAQIIPVYKKTYTLDKQKYISISIHQFSKLFEKSTNFQLRTQFENVFNPFLGAFSQSILLR